MIVIKNPPTKAKEHEVVPEGTHLALLHSIADLGMQDTTYNGEAQRKHKLYFAFEVPSQRMNVEQPDGTMLSKPMWISRRYTASWYSESHLYRDITSWRGHGFKEDEYDRNGQVKFDVCKCLGKAVTISVMHKKGVDRQGNPRTWANIQSITGIVSGTVVPEMESPKIYFSPDHAEHVAMFEKFPYFVRQLIADGHPSLNLNPELERPAPAQPAPAQPAAPVVTASSGAVDLDDSIPF